MASPFVDSLLAVCAHPDDESFGLGAALAAFTGQHTRAGVLCFTRGEASTLGTDAGELRRIRTEEL
jgi:LmbE family N-acetylglucosaminyl deacetylase